jgi:KipI family sensor histidine kinase inhibitor
MTQHQNEALEYPAMKPAGDQAVAIDFAPEISNEVNDSVYALAEALMESPRPWMTELVPSYRSLLVQYDAFQTDYEAVAAELGQLIDGLAAATDERSGRQAKIYEIPVAYGGDDGPDLEAVAEHAGLSTDEVVQIHSSIAYRVFMIGFSPGFPYLGGMDERIACPRLATPRTRVPAGSVGIAESQTGVYPSATPGGWQLIGRTVVKLFDQTQDPPSVLQPGHFVRFVPVKPDQQAQIED